MKSKFLNLLSAIVIMTSARIYSQPTFSYIPENITPSGIFDKVSDRFGNHYNLSDINLRSPNPFASSYSISTVPTESCIAGYFTLFFQPGSMFATTAASVVICQVFSDISGLISSTIPAGSINIYCENNITGLLGSATPVILYPNIPVSATPGIIDGLIHRALVTGTDPYSTIPITNFSINVAAANNFYHGIITASVSSNWNFNMGITNIGNNDYDFYSVMLHEAIHALGFLSLISATGESKLGLLNNYYATYDQFLEDKNGTPLLVTTNTCSTIGNLSFNSSLTPSIAISQSMCPGTNADLTTCSVAAQYSSANVTATVYTPFCFEVASSLSHFEDMCSWGTFTAACSPTPAIPGYNNLYYVMANSGQLGPCFVKRYIKEEERLVLCDLGYSLTSLSYTSPAAGASHTYVMGCSPTPGIVGLHDGYSGGIYSYTSSSTSFALPTASLLINDIGTGLSVACLEPVYNNCTVTIGGGNFTVTAMQGTGMVLLRYFPQNSNGQGNATYVYIYFQAAGCIFPGGCNLVTNPGFESLAAGNPPCGYSNGVNAPFPLVPISLACWELYENYFHLFTSGCNTSANGNAFNLGLNSFGSNPIVGNYNSATGNNNVLCLTATTVQASAMKNILQSPLVNGQPYRVSFWARNLPSSATTSVSDTFNPNNVPAIISIASNSVFAFTPTLNFPAGLNPIIQFSVAPSNYWSLYTNTFTYSGPSSNALLIGMDASNKANAPWVGVSPNLLLSYIHCFIDDITLEAMPSTTFVLPQTVLCNGSGISNLGQYCSTVTNSLINGAGVGYNFLTSIYDFNAAGTLTPGIYPISFTYTNGPCAGTLWQNVVLQSTVGLATTGNATYCATTGTGITIGVSQTGSVAGLTYSWEPGGLVGASQVVSPSVTVIYTVSVANSSVCSASATLAINVFTNCCGTKTYTPFNFSSLSYTGGPVPSYSPTLLIGDLTILSPVVLRDEILIFKDVQITVASGAILDIQAAHLHACGNDMWKGIVVEDGARLNITDISVLLPNHNLIEDAITAVAVNDHTTSSLATILNIYNTTFNKNFIDIKISNYKRSASYTNVFSIHDCVFTCRDIPYTATTWPSVSTSTSGLRCATTATTGLAPPYGLLSAPEASLLAPHAGETSSIAICMSTVGITTSSVYYVAVLGSTTAAEFNLFDNHQTFIDASVSNLTSINNVFQNTKAGSGGVGNGSAIYHHTSSSNSTFNSRLDMTAANKNIGNRFWNCHRGIEGKNIYRFEIDNAIFRSTQTYTLVNSFGQGHMGITLNTNRFRYWILNNEFTNLNYGINIPIAADNTSLTTICNSLTIPYGIYAGNITVQQNTFSPGSGLSTYFNKAITITSQNQTGWCYASAPSLSPAIMGIFVNDNLLTDVFRGIEVNGMWAFPARIENNTINLQEDNLTDANQQHGIDLVNCYANATTYGKHVITGNYLYGLGSSTLTTPASLIYCGNNTGAGLQSPSVTCNDVRNCHDGFVFDGPNQGTIWRGNQMQSLAHGMLLSNGGVIGTQGGSSLTIGNGWNGTWTSNTNYGIFTYSSVAASSILWVNTSFVPPNLTGVPTQSSYAVMGLSVTSGGSGYNCHAPTAIGSNPSIPNAGKYATSELFYIAQTALYRFLNTNDSILNSDAAYTNFYDDLDGSSIDIFMQAEAAISKGDLATAEYLKGTVTSTNNVEDVYIYYYDLYLAYANNNFQPTNGTDEANLITLASRCPGMDGAGVYQARALYNSVFNFPFIAPICSGSGARMANYRIAERTREQWEIKLFPNPTNNRITIESTIQDEVLVICINDLSGRTLLTKELKLDGFFTNLDLSLINGVYLFTITNKSNHQINKKLLIAK
jgi:hypothetical protein